MEMIRPLEIKFIIIIIIIIFFFLYGDQSYSAVLVPCCNSFYSCWTLRDEHYTGNILLQSICAVLTFDPQLKKILTFSVKDRYQLNYFICIKDFNAETNTSLKLNLFSFFICGCQHFNLFLVLMSEQIGRRLPVFTLLLWQRQHISRRCSRL
jgi:hypothetical protein